MRVESEPVNSRIGIREQPDDSRRAVRRVDGHQSALVVAPAGDAVKCTAAIKRDAAQAIKTSIPDKGCALDCDVNQPEAPAAVGIIAAGRAVKNGIRSGGDIDHARHAESAVREAEIRIRAGLRKSVFINELVVGKSSGVAVRIIRGTKLPIDGARIAAGDTVAVTKPGPSNGIADRDICCGRRKRETICPYRNIENLAGA